MEKGVLKPPRFTKLRRLRRILNVAVRKKLLPSNPCWGVEFPVAVKGLFRPLMFRGRSGEALQKLNRRGERVCGCFGTGGMMNRSFGTVLRQSSPGKRRTRTSEVRENAVNLGIFRVGA